MLLEFAESVQCSALRAHCPEVDSEAKDMENCRYTLQPMLIADARLKTEKETAVAMPCLLRESSSGNLRACATLMEASSGTPEADNERAYDGKHMGHISKRKCVGSFQHGQVHKPIAI